MTEKDQSKIKFDIRFDKSLWVVTILNNGSTEHRSFRQENDARAYAGARVDYLRKQCGEIRISTKVDKTV
ncbi:hypothetical protein LJR098_006030 [Rhizobium sp. LjRoot98]|uniref:hypothetical protein n=1 Tax=unclassified Rhizobium TaxID=2613769 RepID=UPI000712AD4C|nr:hypothetical protein [Rhizobium sp. Root1204]KQV41525.1 hypothetical protein ASC96_17060 [Rhizobium sp. Root1204]